MLIDLRRRQTKIMIAALLPALISACASRIPVAIEPEAPGFLLGLWQGLIAPPAFLISLFDHDVAVYAVPNDGGWYDAGFLLGVLSWGGGGVAAKR